MTRQQCCATLLATAAYCAMCSPAAAAVLALSPTTQGNNLRVIDVTTRDYSLLEATSCCAVQAGTVAADVADHRVYFIANRSDGADLYAFGYGVGASLNTFPLTNGMRVTHMDYDAFQSRLVGFVAVDSGGIDTVTINPGNGNVVVTGALGPDCCTLRAGVSAYRASSGTLYAVGRRSSDSNDQLLAFSVTNGTLVNAYDLGAENVVQLVVDGGALYALSYDKVDAVLRPAQITLWPTLTLTPIGTGTSDCCFVLAGPAVIDHANNALVTLTHSSATAAPFAIQSFSLSNGAATLGNAVSAMGLFEDSVELSDRIFADGFEVVITP